MDALLKMLASMTRLSAFLITVLFSLPALARIGDGFLVGDNGRLHLGVAVDGKYDSNVGVGFSAGAGQTAQPDIILRPRGTFMLDIPGNTAKLSLSGGVDWNQYLGLFGSSTDMSFIGGNLSGMLTFNPQGKVQFDISDNFSRNDRVTSPALGTGVLTLINNLRLSVHGKPGGGALELGAFYDLGIDLYSPLITFAGNSNVCSDASCLPEQASGFNSINNVIGASAKLRFWPKTGITLEATYGFRSYYNGVANGVTVVNNVNAQPLRVWLGFGTLLNTRWFFSIRAGYTRIGFSTAAVPTVNDVVAQGEVGIRLTDTFTARIGGIRNVDSLAGTGGFYSDNRGFFKLEAMFNKLTVSADAGVGLIGFGTSSRSDVNAYGTLRGDYHFADWISAYTFVNGYNRSSSLADLSTTAYSFARYDIGFGAATVF